MGVAEDAPERATILAYLGNILVLQGKGKEAQAVYAQLDKAIESWSPPRQETYKLSGSRIAALYVAGQVDAGIAAAEELVKRENARKGPTASTRRRLTACSQLAMRDPNGKGTRLREFRLRFQS